MKRNTIDNKDYYLGLDMGTSSVGWAVTDTDYNLLRFKGKDLWGIREFEEAETAEKRRMYRVSRRRRQREVVRVGLVKEMFHDALAEKDEFFLQRLENSKYHLEDKVESVRQKNGLFNDKDYTDADYYHDYPTIFHLRQELIHNSGEHDVRLVYLAVLNIFKHRGHFLNAGLDGSVRSMSEAYASFADALNEYLSSTDADAAVFFESSIDTKQIEDILGKRDFSRTEKSEQLQKVFQVEKKNKRKIGFLKLISGLKVDMNLLFDLESEEKPSLSFVDNYEEKLAEIESMLEESHLDVIRTAKEMHDIGALSGVMRGHMFLSDARVADYEKHGEDLRLLKNVIREYGTKKDYNRIFREEGTGSYSAYVNSSNSSKGKCRRNMKGRKREDLYKEVSKLMKSFPDDVRVEQILRDIETETFLPKQMTSSNGVIPNQVHQIELKRILDNAAKHLPFLCEKDNQGLTVSEKILQLFSFQIPYYVGPVTEASEKHGGNGWVVRRKDGPVLPWTLEETIDLRKTSERFIERLIRECTYISGEKVLPKASLQYERFAVLNEINNIRIDGERIAVGLKQEIYEDLFKTGKRVTRRKLFNYLRNRGMVEEETQITGIDIQINNSLSSYGLFAAVFGDRIREDLYREIAEKAIYWGTVYGEDRASINSNLKEMYGSILSEEQINRIGGFRFRDWGRLSAGFLNLQGCYKPTGEIMSLLDALWSDDQNRNLMELLHDEKYTFGEELEKKRTTGLKTLTEFTYEDMDEMYYSTPVKRMIWQTVLVMRELLQITGKHPKRVFIEMTRSEGEKGDRGRKNSRAKQLTERYKRLTAETPDWKKEMLSRIDEADSNGKLRSKKLYLYFTQMGRCMYTGEPIDLNDLFNDNLYDIDHVYPRHFVKDDSIHNNLVLVNKPKNAHKSDSYPIEAGIRKNPEIAGLWKKLKDNGLITEEKYRRLTGSRPFSDDQLAGFIARQMVETGQGTKGVADLLKQLLPEETDTVYVKAGNVSDFRHEYGMLKCRSINDFHHAQDAYLNIIVGNACFVKFTRDPRNFILREYRQDTKKNNYHLGNLFRFDIQRGNEVAWKASSKGVEGTISTVKRTMNRNTPLLTRMSFIGHGGIANQTLYGAAKATPENYIPLKSSDARMSDVKKYGGFTSASTAYFILVEHGQPGKRIRTLEAIPLYLAERIDGDPGAVLKHCVQELRLENPSVRMAKIPLQALIVWNGYRVHLSGKTGNRLGLRNAVSLCLRQEWVGYIHDIDISLEKGSQKGTISKERNQELYDILIKKHENGVFNRRPNPIINTLKKGRKVFETLNEMQQAEVLAQIVQMTRIGVANGNMSLIEGAPKSGVMLISKKLTNDMPTELVNQSVTGVFEQSVNLLTV